MQGKLWDVDYEFKAECFSNCFGLWSRCPSRIHPKDPPKPHTLMALNGVITPRDERSEVFVLSLRSSTKCLPRSCPCKHGRDSRLTHLCVCTSCKCQLLGSDIGLRAILHHSPYATVCIRDARPTHLFILRLRHCQTHYQIDNGKLFWGCKMFARGV